MIFLLRDEKHQYEIYDKSTEYSEYGEQCIYHTHYGDIKVCIVGNGSTYACQFAPDTGTLHFLRF